jgi:hypothetical protein
MNWRRGLWRIWIGLTVLWLVGVGYLCLSEFSKTSPFAGQFLVKTPTQEGLSPQFAQLEEPYHMDWENSVKEGKLIVVQFPDHARLYLSSQLTPDDQENLAEAFHDQRWVRYGAKISAWLGLAIGVPLAALCLGMSMFWIVERFYSARS